MESITTNYIKDLCDVCKAGDLERVQYWLGQGVNVNQDNYRYTPLYTAAEGGHLEIVKLLIKHDANVYATTEEGKTILYIALQSNNQEIIKLVKKTMQI